MGEAEKQPPKQLAKYTWKKGQSGNPAGRPPGKTLKEFAREYLMSLPDDEKIEYLASLPGDIVWKMAEGNPANNIDLSTKGEKLNALTPRASGLTKASYYNAKRNAAEVTQKRVSNFPTTNGVRVEAHSTGKSVRGRLHGHQRPDFLLLDDFETSETPILLPELMASPRKYRTDLSYGSEPRGDSQNRESRNF